MSSYSASLDDSVKIISYEPGGKQIVWNFHIPTLMKDRNTLYPLQVPLFVRFAWLLDPWVLKNEQLTVRLDQKHMCCVTDKALYSIDAFNDSINHIIADDVSRLISRVGDYSWVISYIFGTSEAEGSEQDDEVVRMGWMWTKQVVYITAKLALVISNCET